MGLRSKPLTQPSHLSTPTGRLVFPLRLLHFGHGNRRVCRAQRPAPARASPLPTSVRRPRSSLRGTLRPGADP